MVTVDNSSIVYGVRKLRVYWGSKRVTYDGIFLIIIQKAKKKIETGS